MATSKKANKNDSKLMIKILKSPIRMLVKARDVYVKSFSINSTRSLTNDEEFKELVRSLALMRKIDNDLLTKEQMPIKVLRSRTVAFGRIDEEGEECEFLMNYNIKSTFDLYPRSKSVAFGPKRSTFVF